MDADSQTDAVIATGTFRVREDGTKLPGTVTLFIDRERTQGYQIPRDEPVEILAIEDSGDGDSDDYDLVNVRVGSRTGWISRIQFESIERLEDQAAATNPDAAQSGQPDRP